MVNNDNIYNYVGFLSHGDTPIAGWCIILQWKIPLKWMRTGGTPISGNLLSLRRFTVYYNGSILYSIFPEI